jgi:hypothetical protein
MPNNPKIGQKIIGRFCVSVFNDGTRFPTYSVRKRYFNTEHKMYMYSNSGGLDFKHRDAFMIMGIAWWIIFESGKWLLQQPGFDISQINARIKQKEFKEADYYDMETYEVEEK